MSAIHEHVLQNGMTLLCWPQRHLHGLEFGLYLKGGPLYETEETQGISNLLEHLCFRGLGGLNREGLLRELNRFGTNLDAATYAEGLVFRLKCLPRFFDAALEYFLRFSRMYRGRRSRLPPRSKSSCANWRRTAMAICSTARRAISAGQKTAHSPRWARRRA